MVRDAFGAKTERSRVSVAGLCGEPRPVNTASVEARGSASLQSAAAQAKIFQSLAQ